MAAVQEVEGWGIDGLDAEAATELLERIEETVQPQIPPPEVTQTYASEQIDALAALGVEFVERELDVEPGESGVFLNNIAADPAGRKINSFDAYVAPVWPEGACAGNLRIIQGAVVSKVVTDRRVATGVHYTTAATGDAVLEATAAVEVILAAGPYGSPQLLQLSGIGPRRLLRSLGIPLVRNLPVGASTSARALSLIFSAYPGMPLAPENNSTVLADPAQAAAFAAGEPSVLGVGLGATITLTPNGYFEASTVLVGLEDTQTLVTFCLLNPSARGSLEIVSTDPAVPPAVDTNFLGTDADVAAATACRDFMRDVNAAWDPAFLLTELSPGADTPVTDSIGGAFHFVAGAPVGAVLDGGLRVRGVDRLRVCDISAVPTMPTNAGPMTSAYLVAEHLAAVLIAEAPPVVERAAAAAAGDSSAAGSSRGSGGGTVRAAAAPASGRVDVTVSGRGSASSDASVSFGR